MQDEGYIKFTVDWIDERIPHNPWIPIITRTRAYCYDRGWIGRLPSGIGYGNISVRLPDGTFLISGTQTGHKRMLTRKDFAIVSDYDIQENRLQCLGMCRASSESMTHASVYEADASIGAVIHIHNGDLWQQYLHQLPTTDPAIPYGTPAMAEAVQSLVKRYPGQVIVMGGHEGGLIAYGESLRRAQQQLVTIS